jgi:hypothetical protein
LQRNAEKCAHCGRIFGRVSGKIPLVNRSDETSFHLVLLSGPNPRPRLSGGFHLDQLMCNFVYAHDQIGPTNYFLVIFILRSVGGRDEVRRQIEEAADKIADLLQAGKKIAPVYTSAEGQLTPGFPK